MKKILLTFVALFAAMSIIQAQAPQTLTVADGTQTNSWIPISRMYTDEYQHNQYIFPDNMLTAMRGNLITKMQWHLQSTCIQSQQLIVTIKMAVVTDDTLASLNTTADLTTVWSGPYTGMVSDPEFIFSSPYLYISGNLLIDITTTVGEFRTNIEYSGINRSHASWYCHSSSAVPTSGGASSNFLPKTTFTYTSNMNVCIPPQDITVDSTNNNSISISWQADAAAQGWLVSSNNQTWMTCNTNHYTFTGLQLNQPYTLYVRKLCETGDTSELASIMSRTTCGVVQNFPYIEDFENGGEQCWTIIDSNYYSSDNWRLTTPADRAGHSMFSRYGVVGQPSNDWLITPAIQMPVDASGFMLIWWGKNRIYSNGARDPYAIRVSTATNAVEDFTDSLTTIFSTDNEFHRYSIPLNQYAGQRIYIAFHHYTTENSWGIYIDDVTIKNAMAPVINISEIPQVDIDTPTTIHASLIEGANQNLVVTWTSSLCPSCVTGNGLTATLNYHQTGIDTLTCTVSNHYGTGKDTVILRVVDRTPITVLPYSTGFEVGQDTNWITYSSVNNWCIGSATSSTGNRSMYISTDNGATHTYSRTVHDSRSYALRRFQFADTGDYIISYDWHNVGQDNGFVNNGLHSMRVALGFGDVQLNADLNLNFPDNYEALMPIGWIDLSNGRLYGSAEWQTVEKVFHIYTPGLYQLVIYWHSDDIQGVNPPGAIDNLMLNRLTCKAPDSLVVGKLNHNMVTLHWTPRGEETQWNVRVGDIETNVNTPYCTISGLTPSTDYLIAVRAICGDGDTSFSLRGEITTECDAIDLPVTYTFETDSAAPIIEEAECWRLVSPNTYRYNNEDYNTPASAGFTAYTHTGDRSLFFYATSSHGATITTPEINHPGNHLTVRFWTQGFILNGGSVSGVFEAGVMTNPLNSSSFIPLLEITDDTLMQQYEFNTTTIESNAPVCVAFRCTTQGATSYISIDDILIEEYNPCEFVRNVEVRDITGEDATVTWNAPNSDVLFYHVVYGIEGQYTDSITIGSNSCTISGLYPSTNYNVKVRTVCTEGISSYSEVATFMTRCPDVTEFPYTESFENGFGCWNILDGNNDNITWNNLEADDNYPSHSGSRMAASYSWYMGNEITPDEWLISPRMALPYDADSIILSWYFIVNEYNPEDNYTVYVSTTSNELENFVALDSVTGSFLNSVWTAQRLDLSAYAGQNIYFAFRHHNCSGANYIMLDDIRVNVTYPVAPCNAPVITSTSVTPTTATINYTAEATRFEAYVTQGTWEAPQAGVTVNDSTFTFTGLTPNQQYILGVRSICENAQSEWVTTTVTTRTSDDPCTAPEGIALVSLHGSQATLSWTSTGSENTWEINYNGTIVAANTNPFTVTDLTEGTQYTARVRAVCGDNYFSEWSSPITFVAGGNAIASVEDATIVLYPNPANSKVTISGVENATVSVVDMNGREVSKNEMRGGTLTLNVATMAKGAYFVRIVGERTNAIRKLIVK